MICTSGDFVHEDMSTRRERMIKIMQNTRDEPISEEIIAKNRKLEEMDLLCIFTLISVFILIFIILRSVSTCS